MRLTLGPTPHNHQLKEILRKWIGSGKFKPNVQLPMKEHLCLVHSVNQNSVGRAIKILVDEGRLRRGQGGGIFVSRPSLFPAFFHLTDLIEGLRWRRPEPSTKLLGREEFPTCQQICAYKEAVKGPWPRLVGGWPMTYEVRHLGDDLYRQLKAQLSEVKPGSAGFFVEHIRTHQFKR